MTETGDAAGGAGDDTPTPSQGIPQVPAAGTDPAHATPAGPGTPGSGSAGPDTPPASGTPGTPGSGETPGGSWQAPNPPPYPQYPPPGGLPPFQQGGHWAGSYSTAQWNPQGLGKPGVIALRPLNLGDILDGAITAIRRYPLLILGSSAVVAVITSGLTLVIQLLIRPATNRVATLGPAATPEELRDAALSGLGDLLLAALPTLLIVLVTRTLLTGFLTVVMGKAVLGRPVTFGDALKEAGPRILPLIAVTLVYGIACIGAGLFCLLPAAFPFAFWALASPALVLERGTFRQAFSRSARLVSGTFWRVLGILLLASVIAGLLSSIIELPFGLGSGALSGLFDPQALPSAPSTGSLLLTSVGSVIAETIVTPFTALVTVLLYIDQRMRKEGMDIELARAAGIQAPPRQAW